MTKSFPISSLNQIDLSQYLMVGNKLSLTDGRRFLVITMVNHGSADHKNVEII